MSCQGMRAEFLSCCGGDFKAREQPHSCPGPWKKRLQRLQRLLEAQMDHTVKQHWHTMPAYHAGIHVVPGLHGFTYVLDGF